MRHSRFVVAAAVVVVACAAAALGGDTKPESPGDVVIARVANSRAVAVLLPPGFAFDVGATRVARAQIGDKALVSGRAFGGQATLSLVVERDARRPTGAEWRTRLADGAGEPFDVGGVACCDRSSDGGRRARFDAFAVDGSLCFDLAMSADAGASGSNPLTRETFGGIVKSFRVFTVRRGEAADYSDDCLALMGAAARHAPDQLTWLAAEAKARPEDWLPSFVLAETMRAQKAPDADCIAPYTRALALLDRSSAPGRADVFARAVAEDGLGIALVKTGRAAESVPHFQRGYDAAWRVDSTFRASLAYDLAWALATKGDVPQALDALRTAIEANGNLGARAAKDEDFAALRALPAFQLIAASNGDGAPPDGVAYGVMPKSDVRIALRVPGFQNRAGDAASLGSRLGRTPIVCGTAGGDGGPQVWVVEQADEPHASSAAWRTRLADGRGKPFEAGDVACMEMEDASLHAYVVAAGRCFDLRIGPDDRGGGTMPREAFVEVVKSFRAYCLTAGWFSDYAPEILECMNSVATRMPTAWLEWLQREEKSRPDDYVPWFVHGETLSTLRLSAADMLAPYTRALSCLDKRKDVTRETVFVRMLCEDNLGGARYTAGDFAGAVFHAQHAVELAKMIASPLHGHLALRLARWSARKGDAAAAVVALREALATAPYLRASAASETDFAPLREDAAFNGLIAAPSFAK